MNKKEIINIAIVTNTYDYKILLLVWKYIEKKLPQYDFNYIYIKNYDHNILINDIKNQKYDTSTSLINITKKRKNLVNFIYPIFLSEPNIFYRVKEKIQDNYISYFIKSTLPWIILLIIFSIFFAFLLYISDTRSKSTKKIYSVSSAFLGQNGGLVNQLDESNIINVSVNLLIVLFIYFIFVFIYSQVIGKTIHFYKHEPRFIGGIKNKKIVISPSHPNMESLKKEGAIPIIINRKSKKDILKYYLDNDDKYDGIYLQDYGMLNSEFDNNGVLEFISNSKTYKLKKDSTFHIDFGLQYNSFPVNKKKKKFLNDFNRIFLANINEISSIIRKKYIFNGIKKKNILFF